MVTKFHEPPSVPFTNEGPELSRQRVASSGRAKTAARAAMTPHIAAAARSLSLSLSLSLSFQTYTSTYLYMYL